MAKNKVWVCRKCKNGECLAAFVRGSDGSKVKLVRCQGICKGPVAGVRIDGRMEWFSRVDRPKAMVALVRSARKKRRSLPPALERRRVERRSGRPPRR